MTAVGELALWVAFFLSVWGSAVSFAGGALRRPELVESGARAISATAAMSMLASLGLWAALLSHDFSLEYVASHTTLNTPTAYLITAFWAGTGGALLSWVLALSLCAAVAVAAARRRADDALPRIAGTLAGILAVGLAVICFATNPYDRVAWVPAEGQGLSAHLQTPLAIPHFVTVYAAYAAATVAVVLVIGTVGGRRPDGPSLAPIRPWALAAWCLLAIAVALRLRWKYVEPALGGIWSWDPAEVANIVLWLGGTVVVASLIAAGAEAASGGGRRHRAVGMYVVYLGVGILLLGAVGRRWWTERTMRLRPGQAAELADPYGQRWRFVSQGASRDEQINYLSTGVAVEAWHAGASAGIVSAERRQYLDSAQRPIGEPDAEPGIRSSIAQDVYILLAEVRGETAELRVAFRPIVSCVWIGCTLVVLGALATAVQSALGRGVPAGIAHPAAG